jgi:hypothetical protein
MAAQVGLLFVPFGIELIGFREQFPIDVLGAFPGIVNFVLGEFCRKTMKRTLVDPTDKSFHHLVCQQFQILEKMGIIEFRLQFHDTKLKQKKA